MCAAEHPEIVARLTKLLEKYVADGRSTPGAPQQNTGEVKIRQKPGLVHPRTALPRRKSGPTSPAEHRSA